MPLGDGKPLKSMITPVNTSNTTIEHTKGLRSIVRGSIRKSF